MLEDRVEEEEEEEERFWGVSIWENLGAGGE